MQDISWLAITIVLVAPLIKLPLNYRSGATGGLGVRGRLLTTFYLIPRGEFTLVLGTLALQSGTPFVAQVAVLMVLMTIPVGALAIQVGPALTRAVKGRRLTLAPRRLRRGQDTKDLHGS